MQSSICGISNSTCSLKQPHKKLIHTWELASIMLGGIEISCLYRSEMGSHLPPIRDMGAFLPPSRA